MSTAQRLWLNSGYLTSDHILLTSYLSQLTTNIILPNRMGEWRFLYLARKTNVWLCQFLARGLLDFPCSFFPAGFLFFLCKVSAGGILQGSPSGLPRKNFKDFGVQLLLIQILRSTGECQIFMLNGMEVFM